MTDNKTEGKNFRRYEAGETPEDWDLEDKIFKADHSYKCPTYIVKTPPCSASCPSGHDIRGWLAIARGMDKPVKEDQSWQEYAFERMSKANPFPGVMGRVCPAPCQEGCNRNVVDDFVGINALEHYIGEWAAENDAKYTIPSASTGKKVAVIGGGPGGLSAAGQLRLQGHAPTIIEADKEVGGKLRQVIPTDRLPENSLKMEIDRIKKLGVEIKTNTKGWTKVELLGFTNNNKIIIQFKDGTTVVRKAKNVRWCVTRKIGATQPNKKWSKQFKSKKARKRTNKSSKRPTKAGPSQQ